MEIAVLILFTLIIATIGMRGDHRPREIRISLDDYDKNSDGEGSSLPIIFILVCIIIASIMISS